LDVTRRPSFLSACRARQALKYACPQRKKTRPRRESLAFVCRLVCPAMNSHSSITYGGKDETCPISTG